jgi:hypothetical protein
MEFMDGLMSSQIHRKTSEEVGGFPPKPQKQRRGEGGAPGVDDDADIAKTNARTTADPSTASAAADFAQDDKQSAKS